MELERVLQLAKEADIYKWDYQLLEYKFACEVEQLVRFAELVRQDEQIRQMKKMEELKELVVQQCLNCCEAVSSDEVPFSQDKFINGVNQSIDEIQYFFNFKKEK